MAMFLVFSVYTSTGGELSPRKVFITLSLLIILRLVAVQWSVHNVLNVFEGWVALVRLKVGITCKTNFNISLLSRLHPDLTYLTMFGT